MLLKLGAYSARRTPYATGNGVNLRAYLRRQMALPAWFTAVKMFYNKDYGLRSQYGRRGFYNMEHSWILTTH